MQSPDIPFRAKEMTDAALVALVESSSDSIIGHTLDGIITSWNRSAERIYGFSAEKALGQSIDIIVPESQRLELARILARLRRGERVEQIETKRQHKDGAVIDMRLTISPIFDQSGCIKGASAVGRDITFEKKAGKVHVSGEETFRSSFDDAPVPMALVSTDGTLLRVNRLATEFLGYERHELDGVPVAKVTHPSYRSQFAEYRRYLDAGGTDDFEEEKQYIRKDGTEVWGRVHSSPSFDETGALAHFVAHIQDMTDQRRAEQALGERELELQAMFDSALDAIVITDDDRRYINANPAAETLLALSRNEILGKRIDDFVIGGEAAATEMWAVLRSIGSLKGTFQLQAADGNIRLVDYAAVANALPGQHLAILRDVTESKRLAEKLQQAQVKIVGQLEAQNEILREVDRQKDAFLALVSHELRTPITSILGYLELVLEDETGEVSEDQRNFLSVVERNSRRLLRLVGDLLFMAQVEAGKFALELADTRVDELAREAIVAATPSAEEAGITLELAVEETPVLIGDAQRLSQLLDNLIVNAIKFTPQGGRVKVSVQTHDNAIQLGVSDTGMGIQAEELSRLFERFHRTSDATAKAIQGTGLGLSICKAIAESHGGEISVNSRHGQGSTFLVTLPLDRPVPATADIRAA